MCSYSPIRISFLIITLFTTVLHTPLFARDDIEKNGNIHGAVTTSDGTAAAFVTVQIRSLSKGTLTNEDGHFSFSRLKPGSYTLSVSLTGYETIEQTVEVEEGKTAQLSIRLTVSRSQLQEVVISSARGRLVNKNTDYVARMPIANLENPQVYSVVNKELLKEQVVVDAKEALRNAVGAAPVTYPAGGLAISSRGFTTSVNARNGMETVASRSSIDLGNVERLEVIKGPSGTLFGATISSFGGLVNLVTKKPFDTFKGEAAYTFGSFGLQRVTADINTPVNQDKTVLFRLNTAVNRQNSFLNYGHNNAYLVAPSLSYKVNDRLTLLADLEYLYTDQTRVMYTRTAANSGITNPADIKLPYDQTLYLDDANARAFANKLFLQGQYKISGNWSTTTLFSYVSENAIQSYQYYPTWLTDTTAARNVLIYGPIHNDYTNFQQNVNGTFHTGRLRHRLMAGVNYRYFHGTFNATSSRNNRFIDTINIRRSFTALSKAQIDQFMLNYGAMQPSPVSDQRTLSAYASDVVNITDRLIVMLSLRADRFDYKGVKGTDAYKQTSLAPKLGLVYEVVKDQVSVFGNYMSGFQNMAPVNQPDGSQLALDPIFANQWEGGVKMEAFSKKLNLTASYYNISIDNATRTDANLFTIQDGKQVSKGMEVELIASPVTGLSIIAGYAYNDNKIIRASDKNIEGNKAAAAPANVVNVWISYRLPGALKNMGVAAGGNYVDKVYLATDNKYFMPSYTIINGSLFYDTDQWRFDLKLNNIGSRKNWDLYGAPQALRNFAGSVTFKF